MLIEPCMAGHQHSQWLPNIEHQQLFKAKFFFTVPRSILRIREDGFVLVTGLVIDNSVVDGKIVDGGTF